jgi:hypothetical protein
VRKTGADVRTNWLRSTDLKQGMGGTYRAAMKESDAHQADHAPQVVTLFHVSSRPIGAGQHLRPYHMRRRYGSLLVAANDALTRGADAAARLLASAEWVRLAARREYIPEFVLLETVFERSRAEIAPMLPSRLDAVFGWRTLELARQFRLRYRPDGAIYRCIAQGDAATERDGALVAAGINLALPLADELRAVAERATRYWRGEEPMAMPEVLVAGALIVQEQIHG